MRMPSLRRLIPTLVAPLAFSATAAESLQEFSWLTEEYAPYNFTHNGELRGISVEVLGKMWKSLDVDLGASDIRMLPWARGYRMAQDMPGTCLFSTTVTDSRRELFAFVEPIIDTRVVVLARRDREVRLDSLDHLESFTVGVVREDIGELMLREAGADGNVQRADSARSLVRMLAAGRFDAVAYSYDTLLWNMREEGIDNADFDVAWVLKEGVLGIACHKQTDPAMLGRMQEALDVLRRDGSIETIRQRFLEQ